MTEPAVLSRRRRPWSALTWAYLFLTLLFCTDAMLYVAVLLTKVSRIYVVIGVSGIEVALVFAALCWCTFRWLRDHDEH